jgi:fibronectin-binding autotransporter adhesin
LATAVLASGLGQSSAAPANLVLAGGAVGFSGASAASTDRQFTLGGNGGGLDASGASGAPVTFTSTAPLVISGTGPVSLTLSGNNTDENILAAQVINRAAPTSLTKSGAGAWTLANTANSYTGPTTINGGTLAVKSLANGGAASSIGAASNAPV